MVLVRITHMNGAIDIVTTSRAIEEIDVQQCDKVQILDESLLSAAAREETERPSDTDPAAEPSVVVQVTNGTDFLAGTTSGDGVNPVGMVGVVGNYGTLFMFSNENFEYDLNDKDPKVRDLGDGERLADVFSYALSNGLGCFDTYTLTINVFGTANGPKIRKDENAADIMVTRDITDAAEELAAPVQSSHSTKDRLTVIGHVGGDTYGNLKLTADGSYKYDIDETNVDIIALGDGERLTEVYTYLVTDSVKTTAATLTINITGADDGPAIVNASNQLDIAIGKIHSLQ